MKRLIISALALTTIGLAACGEASTDAAPRHTPPVETPAPAANDDADVQIMSIDMAWSSNSAEVCDAYSKVRGTVDRDTLNDYMVSQFEEGYGDTLEPAARDHLIDLIEAC